MSLAELSRECRPSRSFHSQLSGRTQRGASFNLHAFNAVCLHHFCFLPSGPHQPQVVPKTRRMSSESPGLQEETCMASFAYPSGKSPYIETPAFPGLGFFVFLFCFSNHSDLAGLGVPILGVSLPSALSDPSDLGILWEVSRYASSLRILVSHVLSLGITQSCISKRQEEVLG